MTAPLILAEARPVQLTTQGSITVRLAGGGGAEPSFYLGQHWRRGITGLPTIVASIEFNGTDLGTGSVPQAMTVRWAPSSSSVLAELAALHWIDAPITVRCGAGPTPPVLTSGKVIDASSADGVMTLALSDPAADLKKPILTDRYLGIGGIEGPAEWEGKIKRRVWGRVFNLEGECIDAAHQIYCFADPKRALAEISTVRDKGATAAALPVLAWQGSTAATFAALQSAAAPVGGGVVCPSIACVKWWTQPAGSLCADIKGEIGTNYVETAPAIAERIVGAVSTLSFAAGTVAAAIALRPAVVGWVASEETGTAAAALDALLGDVSLLWILDNDQIVLRQWAWGAPVASARSLAVSRKASFKPVSTRRLSYRRNQHVMARDAIAGIVLATDVVFEDGSTAGNLKAALVSAQAEIDQALQRLDAIADDGILSRDEKFRVLIPENERLTNEWGILNAQAAAASASLEVVGARASAAAAWASWTTYRESLSPPWYDTSVDTPVDRALFADRLVDVRYAFDLLYQALRSVVAGVPATTVIDALKNPSGTLVPVRDQIAATKAAIDAAVALARQEAGTAQADANQARADLAAEVTRAQGVEGTITTQLAGVKTTAEQAQANIGSEALLRADGDRALANRTDIVEAKLNKTADSPLYAAVRDVATAFAAADSAIANKVSVVEATASRATYLNRNALFAESWTTNGVPPGWELWATDGNPYIGWWSGVTGNGRYGAAALQIDRQGRDCGVKQEILGQFPAGWYVLEVEGRFEDGDARGSGMLAQFFRANGVEHSPGANIAFWLDPDGAGATGSRMGNRSFSKLVWCGEDTPRIALYLMAGWQGFANPSPGFVRTIWFKAGIRAATRAEIDAKAVMDANVIARITTEETTRASQDLALADRLMKTEAQLAGSTGSQLQSRISTEETARATADSALASRTSSLETFASTSAAGVALNPNFARYDDGAAYPAMWYPWGMENGGRIARAAVNPVRGSLYAADIRNDLSGVFWGIVQTVFMTPGKWVIEATASLDQGSLAGAGVTLSGAVNLDFVGEADLNNAIGDIPGVRSWSKMIDWPYAAGLMNLHAMCGWGGFGRFIAPKYIRWFYLNVRPATDGEIKAGKALTDAATALSRISLEETARANQDSALASRIATTEAQLAGNLSSPLGARVTTTEAAIAGLNGRTAAWFEVVTVAGNNRAQLRVRADANGGAGVDIVGDLRVDGNGIFAGTINPEALALGRFVRRVGTSGGGSPNAGQSLLIASVDIGYLTPAGSYTVSLDGQMTVFFGTAYGSHEGKPLTTTIVPDGGLLVRIVRGATVLVNQLISGADYGGGAAQSQTVPLARQLVFDSPAADTVAGTTTLQLFAVRGSSDSGIIDQGDSYSRVISGTYSGFAVSASVKWTFI